MLNFQGTVYRDWLYLLTTPPLRWVSFPRKTWVSFNYKSILHTLNSCNPFIKHRPKQFLIGIFGIALVPRVFCVCKILKQVWAVFLSDPVTFCSRILFQPSSDSLLFSSHRYPFAKNFFLSLYYLFRKEARPL